MNEFKRLDRIVFTMKITATLMVTSGVLAVREAVLMIFFDDIHQATVEKFWVYFTCVFICGWIGSALGRDANEEMDKIRITLDREAEDLIDEVKRAAETWNSTEKKDETSKSESTEIKS